MQGYWSELLASILSPIRVIFVIVVSFFVGVTGPFGTFEIFNYPFRAIYWAFIIFTAFLLVNIIRLFFQRLFPKLTPVLTNMLTFLVLSFVLTPIIIALSQVFNPPDHSGYKPEWSLAIFVFFTGVIVAFLRYLVMSGFALGAVQAPEPVSPRLSERIPLDNRGEILEISSKDHHVCVRTALGVTKIRLRLTDAIKEMDGVDGICPHRSHWVAVSAVVGHGVNGKPRTFYLTLSDGTQVPVSRKNISLVQAAGLLGNSIPS